MDLGLQNKVALVAAASRGLGRAVAEELAAEGASLVLCAREPRTLAETAATIADNSGAHVLAVPADVTVVPQEERSNWSRKIATGEVVKVGDKFGLRIGQLVAAGTAR